MNAPRAPLPNGPVDVGGYPPGRGPGQAWPDDDDVDLRGVLLPIWRRKWLVILATVLAVTVASLAVLQTVPRYTAFARVIFDPERLRIVDLDDVIVRQDISDVGLQNQIEILRSFVLLERVVEILRLESTPEFNPELRGAAPPPFERAAARFPFLERARGAASALGLAAAPDEAALGPEERAAWRRAAMVAAVNEELRLRPIPNSRVIELLFTSTNPRLAASIVNTIAEQYIVVQTEAKRDDIAAATELLSTRVQDLENRLTVSKEAVEIARLELSRQEGQSAEMTREQLEAVNASLAAGRLARGDLEARATRAAAALAAEGELWAVTEFRESPVIGGYRLREVELLDEIAATRSIVGEGEGNPKLTRLEARLAELRRSIRGEAENIVAALTSDLDAAARQEAALEAEARALEIRAIEQTRAELRLGQLEREALANQTIYESFLSRMKETSVQASLQTSDARFLTRADPPQSPDTASRRRIVLMAALGGIVAGAGLAMLLERLTDTFRSPADLAARTGLPVLAAVPQSGSLRRPRDLLRKYLGKPNGALAEAIRNLRTSILFSDPADPPKVVMFTSSVPGEGKSTTAMLVAVTSQQMGRSAIVVDCDFRRRTLSHILSPESDRPGLVALLEGRLGIDEAVMVEPESGVHLLAQGPTEREDGSPADVLASPRFAALINDLRSRYDLIVLDTPPVLVVTDSRVLARLADAVVYLVRWDRTGRNAVQEGLRELASIKARFAGVVFTLVNEARAAKHVDNEYYYKRRYKHYIAG